MKDKHNQV